MQQQPEVTVLSWTFFLPVKQWRQSYDLARRLLVFDSPTANLKEDISQQVFSHQLEQLLYIVCIIFSLASHCLQGAVMMMYFFFANICPSECMISSHQKPISMSGHDAINVDWKMKINASANT